MVDAAGFAAQKGLRRSALFIFNHQAFCAQAIQQSQQRVYAYLVTQRYVPKPSSTAVILKSREQSHLGPTAV